MVALWGLYPNDTIPIHEASQSYPDSLLKGPSPNTVACGQGLALGIEGNTQGHPNLALVRTQSGI